MNKKILVYIGVAIIFLGCVVFGVTVAFNVYKLNLNSKINQQAEEYVQDIVDETTFTEGETTEVAFTLNDAPIEGIDVNRDVDAVVKELCEKLTEDHDTLLSNFEEIDIVVNSIHENDTIDGYDICLSGLSLIGYYKNEVTVYHINMDGTYDTYPEVFDVEHYVEDVIMQHESALLSADMLVGVDLFSGVFNPIKDINNEVTAIVDEYEYVFFNFRIDDKGEEVDIYGILQNDVDIPIIKCTTSYDTINGKVLKIERLTNEEGE